MKLKTVYTCQKCGGQSPKWLGKCPDCGAWNSMAEENVSKTGAGIKAAGQSRPIPICEVPVQAEPRRATGIGELDRVLGGGIVPGSLVLIGGDPGIGKSTLLLQAMHMLAEEAGQVLYVSGEESASQTRLRGERLGASSRNLLILAENSLESI
ncbi:MAG: ATPase domain-containing protein, partial [Pseudomonadota bacterium]